MGAGSARDREVVGVQSHAEAMVAHPRTRLAAVCDADLERVVSARDRFGPCAMFTDPGLMLDSILPALVTISTPDDTHAELVRLALSKPATRAILVEKPLASRVAEARNLAREASAKNVLLAVNYSRRYCPAFQSLRQEIQRGDYGRIQCIHGFYGKGIVHNGTHWIDLLRFLVGDIADASVLPGSFPDPETPSVQFITASGVPAVLQATDSAAFTLFEMDILGTQGRVQIRNAGHELARFESDESPLYHGHRNLLAKTSATHCLKDAMIHAIDDIVACLDDPRRSPACLAAEAIECLAVASAIQDQGNWRRATAKP